MYVFFLVMANQNAKGLGQITGMQNQSMELESFDLEKFKGS